MSSTPTTTPTSEWTERGKKWREELLKALVIGVPTLFIAAFNRFVFDRTTAQPWQIVWYAIPLAAIVFVTWRIAKQRPLSKIHWSYPLFLILYCALFAVLGASDFLVWKRTPRSPPEGASSWLLPVTLGDWRYWLVPKKEAASPEVIVVMLEPPAALPLAVLRAQKLEMLQLMRRANRVQGVAFDFFFEDATPVDDTFCAGIRDAGFKVYSGYTFRSTSRGDFIRQPQINPLEHCLELGKAQGHLLVWADADERVRVLPLHWNNDAAFPALSVRVAQTLAGEQPIKLPDSNILRYIEPSNYKPPYALKDVLADPSVLSDRFVLIGEKSKTDTFETPFGVRYGSEIHAAAIHSLRSGSYIVRPPASTSALIVFIACYLIALLTAAGASLLRLVVSALLITVGIVALSAAAIVFWSVWLDVVYAIVACWLLIPLVLALRKSRSLSAPSAANS